MTETAPIQRVDLTAPAGRFTYAEILTPAGIVRVNTGLTDTRSGRPVVEVEVEHNTEYRARTAPGGDWEVEVRPAALGSRTDVRLVRRDDPAHPEFPAGSEEKDR